LLFESIRRMLAAQGLDLAASAREALARHAPRDADAVRRLPPLLAFSAPMRTEMAASRQFLFGALYRHAQVRDNTERARQVVRELFAAYLTSGQLPAEYAERANRERAVADYIAGMTDRFALREHHRLTGRRVFDDDDAPTA
jgi:dGTPase